MIQQDQDPWSIEGVQSQPFEPKEIDMEYMHITISVQPVLLVLSGSVSLEGT